MGNFPKGRKGKGLSKGRKGEGVKEGEELRKGRKGVKEGKESRNEILNVCKISN